MQKWRRCRKPVKACFVYLQHSHCCRLECLVVTRVIIKKAAGCGFHTRACINCISPCEWCKSLNQCCAGWFKKKKKRASGVCFYLAHAECLSTEGPRWYHPGGWLLTAVDERFTRGIYVFSITNSIRWKNTFCKLVFLFVLKAMCCTDGIKLTNWCPQAVLNNLDVLGCNLLLAITNEFT